MAERLTVRDRWRLLVIERAVTFGLLIGLSILAWPIYRGLGSWWGDEATIAVMGAVSVLSFGVMRLTMGFWGPRCCRGQDPLFIQHEVFTLGLMEVAGVLLGLSLSHSDSIYITGMLVLAFVWLLVTLVVRRRRQHLEPIGHQLPPQACELLALAGLSPGQVFVQEHGALDSALLTKNRKGHCIIFMSKAYRMLLGDEVTAVVAQLLGYVDNRDIKHMSRRMLLGWFVTVVLVTAIVEVIAHYGETAGPANPSPVPAWRVVQAMPLALLAAACWDLLQRAMRTRQWRKREYRAIAWALEATGDPGALISAWSKLEPVFGNREDLSGWRRNLVAHSRTLAEHVAQAEAWAAAHGIRLLKSDPVSVAEGPQPPSDSSNAGVQ